MHNEVKFHREKKHAPVTGTSGSRTEREQNYCQFKLIKLSNQKSNVFSFDKHDISGSLIILTHQNEMAEWKKGDCQLLLVLYLYLLPATFD